MRDDALRELIRQQNPWWRAGAAGSDPLAWTESDGALQDRRNYDLGYRSDVLADVAVGPLSNGLYILRGPRRVGKSVLLKDLIAALCGRTDIDPWQIIYLAVDTLSAHDLRRAIVLAMEMTRSAGDARRVWVIDEITAVHGWTAELKSLRDNTPLGDHTVILAGSSATGVTQAVHDLGAGRTGSAVEPFRVILPMTFRQFLVATQPEIPVPGPFSPWDVQSSAAAEAAAVLAAFITELDLAWQRYLEAGGFPRAVAEHHRRGTVSTLFLRELESWLVADVDPGAAQESVTLLVAELQARTASPLNVRDLAATLGVNRTYLSTRLNRIVSTFAGLWCPQVDDRGRRVAGAQSKLYLVDPLLGWLGQHLRPGSSPPDYTKLTEAGLGVALARVIERNGPGRWLAADTVGYARTGGGGETDFAPIPVAGPAGTTTTPPVEVKWADSRWRQAARGLRQRYGRGIVTTKTTTFTDDRVWALPTPTVALFFV